MRLDTLLDGVDVRDRSGDLRVDVIDVTHDSQAVRPGALFCALRGRAADGHAFAADAVARGAVAVLGERRVDVEVPQVVVENSRLALAQVAAAFHDHPSRSLTVVGVTGTNGKTTTTYMLRAIFQAAGRPAAVIGSLGTGRTTPEAPALQAELARLRDADVAAAAIEVSSASLVAHRVDAVEFAAAVFTNLGHDHLGEVHRDMDDYYAAKASLFRPEHTPLGVVNVDDEWGRRLAGEAPIHIERFSAADATGVELGRDGSSFTWRGQRVHLKPAGQFNVMNALAAATTARALGIDGPTIAAGLAAADVVPGRLEWVADEPVAVAIDYAHTPEALEQVLLAARAAAGSARVLVVFGCGGDRDRAKRAPMGAAAARLADVAVVTSDNPRHEDPEAIIADVVAGMARDAGSAEVVVEPDRRTAIRAALAAARTGDVVIVAGKGHEHGQQFGDTTVPFDDRDEVVGALRGDQV